MAAFEQTNIKKIIHSEERGYLNGVRQFKTYARLVREMVRPHPFKAVGIIMLLLTAGLLEGIGIAAFLPMINIVLNAEATNSPIEKGVVRVLSLCKANESLAGVLIFIVAVVSLKSIFNFLALRHAAGHFVADLNTELKFELLRTNVKRSWESLVGLKLGHLLSAITVETNRAAGFFIHSCNLAQTMFRVSILLGMAFLISWQVTLIGLASGVVMTMMLWKYVKLARQASHLLKSGLRELSAQVSDVFNNIKPLKAMGKEVWVIRFFAEKVNEINQYLKEQMRSKYGLKELPQIFIVVAMTGSIWVFIEVLGRNFNEFLLLGLVLHRIMTSISSGQQAYQAFCSSAVYYIAVHDFLSDAERDREILTSDKIVQRVPALSESIELRGVKFNYEKRKTVISEVDFEILANHVTALIGPSGVGKTTIANIICGLSRPQSGDVFLDGVPLWQCDVGKWREMIGYVPQESLLFNGTIHENIVLDSEGISAADVEWSVMEAGLRSFLDTLPEGLQARVGERGLKISGGERQRVAIARAIVRRPKLLILDEATTGLDPETERKICDTFKQLSGNMTIFAISHQQLIGGIADRIYRLQDGRIHRVK